MTMRIGMTRAWRGALCGLALAPMAMAEARAEKPLSRAVRIIEEAPKLDEADKPATPVAPAKPAPPNPNAAGLALEVLPNADLPLGTLISFKVTTQIPGYLILVDVDSTGRLTQIYPNPLAGVAGEAESAAANRVEPGAPMLVPSLKEAKEYEFVASPPTGAGMVMGLLSEQPVQVIDLPDVPTELVGQAKAAEFLQDSAKSLRIMSDEPDADPIEPKWSFDAKFYAIR